MSLIEVTMLSKGYDFCFARRRQLYVTCLLLAAALPLSAQARSDAGVYQRRLEANEAPVFAYQNGSNLHPDKIKLLLSEAAVKPGSPYSITGNDAGNLYITFNLEQRQPVTYTLAELTGRELVTEDLGEVLNQTCRVVCNAVTSGIYIVRLRIGGRYYAEKIWLAR